MSKILKMLGKTKNAEILTAEELKEYLKKHLKMKWQQTEDALYIILVMDNEVISRIPFSQS